MVTGRACITIASKYDVLNALSIGIFTFDLGNEQLVCEGHLANSDRQDWHCYCHQMGSHICACD